MSNIDRHLTINSGYVGGPAFGAIMTGVGLYAEVPRQVGDILIWAGVAVFTCSILRAHAVSSGRQERMAAVLVMYAGALIFCGGAAWYFWPLKNVKATENHEAKLQESTPSLETATPIVQGAVEKKPTSQHREPSDVDLGITIDVNDPEHVGYGPLTVDFIFHNAGIQSIVITQVAIAYWEVSSTSSLYGKSSIELCSNSIMPNDATFGMDWATGGAVSFDGATYYLIYPDPISTDDVASTPYPFSLDQNRSRAIRSTFKTRNTNFQEISTVALCGIVKIILPDGQKLKLTHPLVTVNHTKPASWAVRVNDSRFRFPEEQHANSQ